MTIQKNSVVAFHYTVSDEDGIQLDTSAGKDPLTYLHGANNIIPGLELALAGKVVGDAINVTISPDQAYGEYHDGLVQLVPLEAFGDVELEVGMRFEAQTEDGPMPVVITDINNGQATVDGNHPLAGKSLTFAVTVEDIRQASDEEIAHGHAHGPGGHHHH